MNVFPLNSHILVTKVKKKAKGNLLLSTEEYEAYFLILRIASDLSGDPTPNEGECVYLSNRANLNPVGEDEYLVPYKDVIGYELDE